MHRDYEQTASRGMIMSAETVTSKFDVELAPCPFCASPVVGLCVSAIPHVVCGKCGADGPSVEGRDDADMYRALILWNTRI